jgi:hypothetical protein
MTSRQRILADEAIVRKAAAALRTPTERLVKLDAKLGAGVGAKRERAKLAILLAPPPEVPQTAPVTPQATKPPKQGPKLPKKLKGYREH